MIMLRSFLRLAIALAFSGVFAAIQYRKCAKGWSEKGCNIGYHSNLTLLEDDRYPSAKVKIDWDNMNGYLHDLLCRCRQKCVSKSFQYMVINKDGTCFGGPGSPSNYMRTHRLETDPRRCGGKMVVTGPTLPDGSQCIPGIYRGFFYTIEQQAASAEEKEGEEEAASNPNQPSGEEAVASCTEAADVVLVLDISGSVDKSSFLIQKKFTSEFIRRFELSKSRVAIVTYDDAVQSTLDWNKSRSMTLPALLEYVKNIKYTGGSTSTGRALSHVISTIIPQRRDKVHVTCIVMTDGRSTRGEKLKDAASQLRNKYKVTMLALGIGSYDLDQLHDIAGNNRGINTYTYESFQAFGDKMGAELNKLVRKACI